MTTPVDALFDPDPNSPAGGPTGRAEVEQRQNAAIRYVSTSKVDLSTVTASGDLIVGSGVGMVQRLGQGSSGQILQVGDGGPQWANLDAGGLGFDAAGAAATAQANAIAASIPITTLTAPGDLIVGNGTGVAETLPQGTAGQILQVGDSGLEWVDPVVAGVGADPVGSADTAQANAEAASVPRSLVQTLGDMFVGSGAAAVARLPVGPAGTSLLSGSTGPAWAPHQFNVMHPDFGAKGDNVTDDAPAIQAAITAAGNAGGGTVFFPSKSFHYNASTPFDIPANVTLQGSPGTNIGFGPGVNSSSAVFTASNGFVNVDRITFNGRNQADQVAIPLFKLTAGEFYYFTNITTNKIGGIQASNCRGIWCMQYSMQRWGGLYGFRFDTCTSVILFMTDASPETAAVDDTAYLSNYSLYACPTVHLMFVGSEDGPWNPTSFTDCSFVDIYDLECNGGGNHSLELVGGTTYAIDRYFCNVACPVGLYMGGDPNGGRLNGVNIVNSWFTTSTVDTIVLDGTTASVGAITIMGSNIAVEHTATETILLEGNVIDAKIVGNNIGSPGPNGTGNPTVTDNSTNAQRQIVFQGNTCPGGKFVSGGIPTSGTGRVIVKDNPGINPIGVVTAPTLVNGTAVGTTWYDRVFHIHADAGSTCAIALTNSAGTSQTVVTIPAGQLYPVRVPAGSMLTPTFTGTAPVCTVQGE